MLNALCKQAVDKNNTHLRSVSWNRRDRSRCSAGPFQYPARVDGKVQVHSATGRRSEVKKKKRGENHSQLALSSCKINNRVNSASHEKSGLNSLSGMDQR